MVTGEVPEDEYIIPLGVADIKEGTDVTIVSFGKKLLRKNIACRSVKKNFL
jgi:pyruvate dehydrogenase E1 component beta subunit